MTALGKMQLCPSILYSWSSPDQTGFLLRLLVLHRRADVTMRCWLTVQPDLINNSLKDSAFYH